MKKTYFAVPPILEIGKQSFETESVESDNDSLNRLKEKVLVWCLENKLLIRYNDTVRPNLTNGASHVNMYLYELNFRQICSDENLQELLTILSDTEQDKLTTRLVDLYVSICLEIDSRFINLYINKLIYLFENIYPGYVVDHDWLDIFTNFPYLWLIYVIQQIMREHTPL